MKAQTTRVLMWLDLYGYLRMAGYDPASAMATMEEGGDLVQAKLNELAIDAGKQTAKTRQIADSVAGGLGTAAAAIAAIPGGITQIVGGVVAVCAGLVSGLTRLFTWECDKFECPEPTSYHARAIVGENAPPGAVVADDGGCNWFGRKCSFIQYIHDGYLVSKPAIDAPEFIDGVVKGVTAKTHGHSGNRHGYWRKHNSAPSIPAGDVNNPEPGTWYYRSLGPTAILAWMERKIPCRILKCMQEVLLGKDDFASRRRRGGFWYASVWYMMQDFLSLAKAAGLKKTAFILDEIGAKSANAAWQRWMGGKLEDGPAAPFPGWVVVKVLSIDGLRIALTKLAGDEYVQNRQAIKRKYSMLRKEASAVLAAHPGQEIMQSSAFQGAMQSYLTRRQEAQAAEQQFLEQLVAEQEKKPFLSTTTGQVAASAAALGALWYYLEKVR